ncbi:ABC transporter permease [Streptococcus orisasini]
MINIKEKFIMLKAEIIKQRKNYQNSLSNIMSLIVWPIIIFFQTFYTYNSFDLSFLRKFGIENQTDLLTFLITGTLVYNCFWSMVQSAFLLTFERQNGTLEAVFITPTSLTNFLLGRALGGILTNIGMFLSFITILFVIVGSISVELIFSCLLSLIVIIISSTIWGAFINSLFLTSRDSNYLFTICDEPMRILSGTSIPVSAFPVIWRTVSFVFPSTYCLYMVRGIFFKEHVSLDIWIGFIIILLCLVIITTIISNEAYRRNKVTGKLFIY